MNYSNLSLYTHIKAAVVTVMEAEDNSNAWKQEAKERMKDVNALIVATKKVDKLDELDTKDLLSAIREEIAAEREEAQATEEPTEDQEPATETSAE